MTIEIVERRLECMSCNRRFTHESPCYQIGILSLCKSCRDLVFKPSYKLKTLVATYDYYHKYFYNTIPNRIIMKG